MVGFSINAIDASCNSLRNRSVILTLSLQAAFMKRDEFNVLMDQVIERKLLPGNCAQEPKKQVRIMVRSLP